MRSLRAAAFALVTAAVLVACSFTRDLDYLQEGDGDAAAPPDEDTDTGTSSSSGSGGEAGAAPVIVDRQTNPANLIQDADNLYWSTDDNAIMKAPKSGGAATALTKLPDPSVGIITGLALDPAGAIYVIAGGGVRVLSKEGTVSTFLNATNVEEIAVDDTFVFTVSTDMDDAPTLTRYAKANAADKVVLDPAAPPDGYFQGGAVAVFGDSVYWVVDNLAGVQELHQLPKTAMAGAKPTVVWRNTTKNTDKDEAGVYALYSHQLAIDDDGIYWVDDYDAVPYRLLRSAPVADSPSLLNAATAGAVAISVDATHIYVLTAEQVVKILKSDVTSEKTTYPVDATTTAIINDARGIYAVFTGDGVGATGGIQRIAK